MTLVGSATRLHAHHADAVDATQEMNRCLRLVNVVTGRRQTPTKDRTNKPIAADPHSTQT